MNALQSVADAATKATTLQLVGAFLFGMVIGWFVYFVNRHRTEEVKLADVATLVAAIGAGAILVLFPAGTDLFGSWDRAGRRLLPVFRRTLVDRRCAEEGTGLDVRMVP